MSKNTKRRNFDVSWSEVLTSLPLTAQYLKLFTASRAYDFHNSKDMAETWREIAPVIGTKGFATVDNIRFSLGVNKSVQIIPQFVEESAALSRLYKEKYQAQLAAATAGQGSIRLTTSFNVSGTFPTASDITEKTSTELLALMNVGKGTVTATYANFRASYPTAAASLYRRHLLRKVEAKLKTLYPKVVQELMLWESNSTDFNIRTDINNTQPITLAVFEQTHHKASCDETPEGEAFQTTIDDTLSAIGAYMANLTKANKTFIRRTHYISTQAIPVAKATKAVKLAKAPKKAQMAA
jgi:hypothetical protein